MIRTGTDCSSGGEFYGTPEANSLQLLNRYFTKYPEDADKVVLSIKGGLAPDMTPAGDPERLRKSVENCVKLLGGTKKIDMFECARVDTTVGIESSTRTLGELVKEGLIGGVSLSEVSAESVHRAVKVHPIVAVELEVSLWEDNILKNGVAEACAEHSIPIVAYSPIGKGFLTGKIKTPDDLPEGDPRLRFPRFSPENFPKNVELVQKIQAIAGRKGCTPGQLALAWVRQLSDRPGMPRFIPIPGSTNVERVKENMHVVDLSKAELAEIDKVLSTFQVTGTRYPAALMSHVDK